MLSTFRTSVSSPSSTRQTNKETDRHGFFTVFVATRTLQNQRNARIVVRGAFSFSLSLSAPAFFLLAIYSQKAI
jgi:hypothetical protein